MPDHFDAYYEWLGISPKDQPPTYYRLLGVDAGETNPRVIENAADRQMAHIRTFQTGKHSAISQKLLNQIASAKVCLLNAEKKAAYDLQLAAKAAAKAKLATDSAARVAKPLSAQPVAPFAPALPVSSAPNATIAELDAVVNDGPRRRSARKKPVWQRPAVLGGALITLLAIAGGVYVLLSPGSEPAGNVPEQVASSDPHPVDAPPASADQAGESGARAASTIADSEPDSSKTQAVESSDAKPVQPEGRPKATKPTVPRVGVTPSATPASEPAVAATDAPRADASPSHEPDSDSLPTVASDDRPDPPDEATSRSRPSTPTSVSPKADPAQKNLNAVIPSKSGKVINLLKAVNLAKDTRYEGTFKNDNKTLTTVSAGEPDGSFCLVFPYRPTGEYQLIFCVEPVSREAANAVLSIGWLVNNRQVSLTCGNTQNGFAGEWPQPARFTGQSDLLAFGKKTTIIITVLSPGMAATANDRDLGFYANSQQFLGSREGSLVNSIMLECNLPGIRISRVDIQPLKSGNRVNADPIARKAVPAEPIAVVPATAPEGRVAVPSPDDQTRATEQVRDVFKAEFSKVKKPEEKTDLAEKLLQQGIDTQDDLAASYVLCKEARDLASAAGNLTLAVRAVETLTEKFEVDRFDAIQQAVTEVAKHAPTESDARLALVDSALELMHAAAAAGRFDSAAKLATVASATSAKLKDAALKKRVQAALADVKKRKAQFAGLKLLQDTLAEKPDDTEANFKFGKHLCLIQGDWEKGLPHLAKGGDEKLAPLAQQELTKPETAEGQVKLGDAWWDLSASEPAATKPALLARAGHWYQIALPEISGLGKVKIEKRLEQLASSERPQHVEPVATTKSGPTRSGVKSRVGKASGVESPLFGRTDKLAAGELDRHVAGLLTQNDISVGISILPDIYTHHFLNNRQPVPPGDLRVRVISFSKRGQSTDQDMEPLSRLEMFREAHFHEQSISDAGIDLLARSKSLQVLDVVNVPITDRAAQSIARIVSLENLHLNHVPMTDAALIRLADLPELKHLTLEELKISGAGIKSLGKLAKLRSLGIRNLQVNDSQLAPLASLADLQSINLGKVSISGDLFRSFKETSPLSTLTLSDTRLNDAGLKHISTLRSLRTVSIEGSAISETGVKHLATLTELKTLTLTRAQLTDRSILALATLRGLIHLGLEDSPITGEGFRNMPPFDTLVGVQLSNTRINDQGLKYIVAAMPNLQSMDLANAAITDAGMKHLASLSKLRNLYLYQVSITDKGALELQGISSLQSLTIPRAGVSPATIEKLRGSLPGCNINLN